MTGALTRFLTGPLSRRQLPRWAGIAIGVACVVVGAVLTLRPFTSLSTLVILVAVTAIVTGAGELLAATDSAAPRLHQLSGLAWIVAGVAVAAWPGLSIAGIAVWVGVVLLVTGTLRILAGLLGTRAGERLPLDARITEVLIGVAGVVLGVLALAWPDVTVLVVAVAFGVRTVLFGLTLAWTALRHHPRHGHGTTDTSSTEPAGAGHQAAPPRRNSRWVRRSGRLLGAIAALVLALALGSVSIALHKGEPSISAFYTAPSNVPSQPGALLRSEHYTTAVPATAKAWRILYATTTGDGKPALASGIVLVSKTAPAGPRPVIAWAHGTTGFARNCAPSVLKDPFGAGALPALDQIISNGWALVATDYIGLGTTGVHPYLIGPGEAHSVLDAVRAAHHLTDVHLADQTVVWGHSQGGNAALWSGQLAPTYAPDDHVIGVAALAPR